MKIVFVLSSTHVYKTYLNCYVASYILINSPRYVAKLHYKRLKKKGPGVEENI